MFQAAEINFSASEVSLTGAPVQILLTLICIIFFFLKDFLLSLLLNVITTLVLKFYILAVQKIFSNIDKLF